MDAAFLIGNGLNRTYQEQMPESAFLSATKIEKHLLLSQYFCAENDDSVEFSVGDEIKKVDLIPYLSGYANCEVTIADDMQIHGTAEDMQLYFDVSPFQILYMNKTLLSLF